MSASSDSSLVPIGHLSKAHGIRGEVVLVLEADSLELVNGELFLRPRGQRITRKLTVVQVRLHHGKLLVSFEGISTRNEAELLCRHTVLIPKDRLPPLEENEIFLSDLPGLRVFVADSSSEVPEKGHAGGAIAARGKEIGIIASVDIPAGQELWTITTPDGKEILFPAVDPFVISIDLEEGAALIAPPPGLLELYLTEATP